MPGENMIYNTGTISINGNTATGTGTNWTAPASQVRAGQTIIVMSNPVQMFQITAINSGTSLTVTPAASPALSGQTYGILVTDSLSVDGLAQSMSQIINEYGENIGAWATFASISANQSITVTINGTSVTIPAIGGLARKGANSDITELKGLTTPLSLKQGGLGANNAADALANLGLGSGLTGVVGAAINARMSVTAPSAIATFTADELIVGVALGGLQYRLGSFNKTINLATTGAGGMDTGTAPVSGYVALYAIYNPTTAASAMLAVNATAAVAPQVYGGANMPAGYTASALISVWPTSSGSQFLTGSQVNRNINTSPTRAVLATTTQYPPGSTISIATLVPPNAVLVSGSLLMYSSETSLMSILISSDSQRSGEHGMTSTVQAFSAVGSSFSNISIPTSQMAGISLTSSTGTPSFSIYITCYSF